MTDRQKKDRLWLSLEMQVAGIQMKRLSLRRKHPRVSEARLDRLLREWLLDRPADAPGRAVSWPRKSAAKK